jgi:hypothetical protein
MQNNGTIVVSRLEVFSHREYLYLFFEGKRLILKKGGYNEKLYCL